MDPVQRRIIEAQEPRIIVCCTRQWGKTTTVAAKAAAEAQSGPGLILIIAPVERQARECFRKIKDCLRRSLPADIWPEENKTSLELPNGARIVAVPAKGENIRGFTNPRLIIIDEAAFVRDEDYRSIRPMLSHGARLILLSTPFGRRGFFHETWERPDDRWVKIMVAADQCSHISADFLAEEKLAIGSWWYEQEYNCKFLDAGAGFFDMDRVHQGLDEGLEPLFALREPGGMNEDSGLKALFGRMQG